MGSRAAWLELGGSGAGIVIVPAPPPKKKDPRAPQINFDVVLFECEAANIYDEQGSGSLEISLQGGRTGDRNISQEATAMSEGDVIKT